MDTTKLLGLVFITVGLVNLFITGQVNAIITTPIPLWISNIGYILTTIGIQYILIHYIHKALVDYFKVKEHTSGITTN